MAKVNGKVSNMIRHRKRWMKELLVLRKGVLKSDSKRKWYLFAYYCTVMVICDDRVSREHLYELNEILAEHLESDELELIIKKAKEQGGSNFTDKRLIRDFGITNEEMLELGIGARKREEDEREKRRVENDLLEQEIIARYKAGEKIADIARVVTKCSKAKIERIIRREGLAQEREYDRNRKIWGYYQKGLDEKDIAVKCDCDVRTVRKVLKQSPSDFHILRQSKTISEAFRTSGTGCSDLFTLYTTETSIAVVDDYTTALTTLKCTKENILITGAAGTAKTTLLNEFLDSLSKEERAATIVTAMTGVASEHIGGSTIHRAFGIGIGVQSPEQPVDVPKALLSINRIVIDEISMCRIDLFEQIIRITKKIEETGDKKIQLIVCGDWGQIEPCTPKEDKRQLDELYPNRAGNYAFDSELWSQMNFKQIRLTYVFRQNDLEFQKNLAAIKYGCIEALEWFNQNCYGKYLSNPIYICARKADVDHFNQLVLETEHWLSDFKEYAAIETNVSEADQLPCPRVLKLAEGIRVMLIANDVAYKNGNLGTVTKLEADCIYVRLDTGTTVKVKRKLLPLESGGTLEQFPMVYGYAISSHKAQGCTFDEVVVYAGEGFFSPGQLYVALSRCRSLEGLGLLKKLTPKDLVYDRRALEMTVKRN